MIRIAALIFTLSAIAALLACSQVTTGGGASPTEAYKHLYAAVKSKNIEAIKSNLTKKTIELAASQAARSGSPIEQIFENGFSETTFSASLPTIRDERVNGNMGAIEVWNSQKSTWDDLPFLIEDGSFKLAVGDIFSGGYKSPGKGRAQIEQEAANAVNPQSLAPSANANHTVPRVLPDPVQPRGAPK